MLQQIITILIIAFAGYLAINSLYRKFRRTKSEDPCDGCNSGCDDCAVMDLKKEIESRKSAKEGH